MDRIEVAGVSLEMVGLGSGPPLVFLHGGDYFAQNRPFLDRLGQKWRVLAPRHPGFGNTPRPDGFRSVHDIAYLYLDLFEQLGLDDIVLAGASFGGWLALELCVRSVARIGHLVLIDSLGVKFGGREERDIADIYALPADELARRNFRDSTRCAPDYSGLGDDELTLIARDREASAFYGWRPYMHDPRLLQWLHRVTVPALVLWGEDDGIVAPAYGRKLSRALPRARFELIADAAHHPQIEQPEAVAVAIGRFLTEDRS